MISSSSPSSYSSSSWISFGSQIKVSLLNLEAAHFFGCFFEERGNSFRKTLTFPIDYLGGVVIYLAIFKLLLEYFSISIVVFASMLLSWLELLFFSISVIAFLLFCKLIASYLFKTLFHLNSIVYLVVLKGIGYFKF